MQPGEGADHALHLRQLEALVAGPSPIAVGSRGRRCLKEGCTTILSIYNTTDHCCLHERSASLRRERRRIDGETIERRCQLATCGARFEAQNPRRLYCRDRCRMAAFALRRRNEGHRHSSYELWARPLSRTAPISA